MHPYSIHKQPTTVLTEVSVRFKKLRKAQNMSQVVLADRSGVSLGSLKRFETTGKISLESLLKLAHLLDRLADFDSLFLNEDHVNLKRLFDK
ncbi:MAG: helix-turn-helix transcriptional regulator [Flavobacteriaceae bacterium]|jgi:transcriptional regulator with XRE-family HTH domain|nr:helix-turn-helix transcriptional regulator [Flavobacteriaceae bacterium]